MQYFNLRTYNVCTCKVQVQRGGKLTVAARNSSVKDQKHRDQETTKKHQPIEPSSLCRRGSAGQQLEMGSTSLATEGSDLAVPLQQWGTDESNCSFDVHDYGPLLQAWVFSNLEDIRNKGVLLQGGCKEQLRYLLGGSRWLSRYTWARPRTRSLTVQPACLNVTSHSRASKLQLARLFDSSSFSRATISAAPILAPNVKLNHVRFV